MAEEHCQICQLMKSKEGLVVYEDEGMKALLLDKPSSPGHIRLFPKKHYTIFEQVPDQEVEKIFIVANKISTAVFEGLNMQGTNILVNNGVAAGQKDPHFTIDIIPRIEGDGLKLDWTPRQLSDDEMSTVELMLKPHTETLGVSEEPEKPVEGKKKEETIKDENYLTQQLRRIP
jgi:histidine triad (HIT) family protein